MKVRYLAVVVGVVFAMAARGAEPFRFPEGRHGKSELRYVNGLPVLTVTGSPEEIGAAVGALALRPAGPMISYPEDVLKHYHAGFLLRPFVAAGGKMVDQFPDDYRRELEGMHRGSDVGREKLVLGNTLFDLKKSIACSVLLLNGERTAAGAPLMGRNLDYPSLGYAHEYSLVTVYHPDGAAHAFASIGFPGLVGCLSGINDAGLSVAVLEVFQARPGTRHLDRSGMPYALCHRRLLESCATIDEASAMLAALPRTTILNLAVADVNGVAVFEVTPDSIHVRGPVDGACVCTNHFCSPELQPLVRLNLAHSANRFESLERAVLTHQRFDCAAVQHELDAVCRPGTLQSMIFEPAARRLHLSIGVLPASAGEMKVLELTRFFRPAERTRP